MANITFKGNAISTNGELPAVGSTAPDFTLVSPDGHLTERATRLGQCGDARLVDAVVVGQHDLHGSGT